MPEGENETTAEVTRDEIARLSEGALKLAGNIVHGSMSSLLIDFRHYGDGRVLRIAKAIDALLRTADEGRARAEAVSKTHDGVSVRPRDTVYMIESNGAIRAYTVRVGVIDEEGDLFSVAACFSTENAAKAFQSGNIAALSAPVAAGQATTGGARDGTAEAGELARDRDEWKRSYYDMRRSARGLYDAIVKRMEPYFTDDPRALDWDVLPSTIAVLCQRAALPSPPPAGGESVSTPASGEAGEWKSCAQWPDSVPASIRYTDDTHQTREQAEAVCRGLEREGMGGDGKVFPVRTWVAPAAVSAEASTAPQRPAEPAAKGEA